MRNRLRNATLCGMLLLSVGCVASRTQGAPHSDFNTEMVAQLLSDVDAFVTNYGWLLALLGF